MISILHKKFPSSVATIFLTPRTNTSHDPAWPLNLELHNCAGIASSEIKKTMTGILLYCWLPYALSYPQTGGSFTLSLRLWKRSDKKNRISCVDGGFPERQKMPTWFGFMNTNCFSIMAGLEVVFTIYLLFGKEGEVSFVIWSFRP